LNILIIYAHPDPKSLNGSLKDFAVAHLVGRGHTVRVSDLYAMGWKAVLDREDFPALDQSRRLSIGQASGEAYATGTQTPDVERQQADLLWADAVIFQFPLWWFSMPAILKGWVDRVYALGFGYGVGEHSETHWGDRYGEGTLQGKRAMLVVSMGGWESHYSERGVNGPIQDILFPINHGILHYPGFDVMQPFLLYKVHSMDEESFSHNCEELGQRLDNLWTDQPIPYRKQNGGDYEVPALTLKPGLEKQGSDRNLQSGFRLHKMPELA
jgi:NAD(P)H dehydrogenase (quinone)